MNVKAIDSVNLVQFTGRNGKAGKSKNPENNYPQMDSPASQTSAKAMRNLLAGLMLLGAAASMGTMNTSCSKSEAYSFADAISWSYGCQGGPQRDTTYIRDTVYITEFVPKFYKGYNFGLADSLIHQGLNIGIPLDGPVPNGSNNVIFVGAKAYNRYDKKMYEVQGDSIDTDDYRTSLITKITDTYDKDNPEVQWVKTIVTDVPNKGIKFDRYVFNGDEQPSANEQWRWNYAGYEVRTNGNNGKSNTVSDVYDKNGKLIWKGEYLKGEEPATFMYGTFVYDENGDPYKDEDGNPEKAYYDFEQAKMYSDYCKMEEIPGTEI